MPRVTFRSKPKTTLGRLVRRVGDYIRWFVILRSPRKQAPVQHVPTQETEVAVTREVLDNGCLHYDFKED